MKRISEDIRRMIVWDSEHGETRDRVADRYGVSVKTVCNMVRGNAKANWHNTDSYGKALLRKI